MTTTTQQDALIDAAEERAKLYDGDDRECIKADVMNAFFAGAQFTQAAANKAAEEGGLSIQTIMRIHDENCDSVFGLIVEPFARAIACTAIAADRASRQVANKAEVEPEFFVVQDDEGFPDFVTLTNKEAQEHINGACEMGIDGAGKWKAVPVFTHKGEAVAAWDWPRRAAAARGFMESYADTRMEVLLGGYHVQPIIRRLAAAIQEWQLAVATPPATTGASTVLTDERITEIEKGMLDHWASMNCVSSVALIAFARAIEREVAAQAGQVAVPEGWPTSQMVDAGGAAVRRGYSGAWRDDRKPDEMLCSYIFRHMIAAAQSPAEESK